jgi:hypothetical protein
LKERGGIHILAEEPEIKKPLGNGYENDIHCIWIARTEVSRWFL